MGIPTQTFQQFVSNAVAAWMAQVGVSVSLEEGDALLAVFQAFATQAVFLQAQAQVANNLARLTTSSGADVDSFINGQFGFPRLPATNAQGPVTLSASGPAGTPAYIYAGPFGTAGNPVVQTPGGGIQYQIIADATQPTWNATLGAYVLNTGQTSLTATAEALLAGAGSNVLAGQLTQIATPIPGIATVTNGADIANGLNAESDTAYKARFVLWLNSLAKATENAILAAIAGVQQGLDVNLIENVNATGATTYGSFVGVIDNGTGDPGSALLTSVFNAVNAVRAFTVRPIIQAPAILAPTIALSIHVAAGYVSGTVTAAVAQAVLAAANAIGIGQTLYVSALIQAALTVPGCAAVEPDSVLINGVADDLAVTGLQEVRTVLANVTVGTY